MTTREDGATRGLRVLQVREEAKMDQRTFVDALNAAARQLGLPAVYDIVKLSKIENEKRDVSLDDAVLVAAVDPAGRTVEWIAGAAELKPLRNGQKRRRTGNG